MDSVGPQCLEVSLIPVESTPSNDGGSRNREAGAGVGAHPGGLRGDVPGQGISGPSTSSFFQHHQAIRAAVASLQIHSSQTEQTNPHHTPLYTTAPLPNRSHIHSQHTSRPAAPVQPYQAQTSLPPSFAPASAPPCAPPDAGGRGPLVSQIWQTGNAADGDAFHSPHPTAPLAPHSTQGHGAPFFPPPSSSSAAAGGVATASAVGLGAIGGVVSALDATSAASGEAIPPGHGISSAIAHTGSAPRTLEINPEPSVPTAVPPEDGLQNLLASSLQGGGGFDGGIPDQTGRRTQTSESGYSKAAVLRPPSAIPIPPIPPSNTSISLSLSQPNGAQPSFFVTNDNSCDHHHTYHTTNTAECNTPLVDSFTSRPDVHNTANITGQTTTGAHSTSAAAYAYSDPQTQPESNRSAVQVASSRIATIANVMTNMNLPDTTPSPSLNSPVLETPHTVSLPEPSSTAEEIRMPKVEIGVEDVHGVGVSGPASTMYHQQDNNLIFSIARPGDPAPPPAAPTDRARPFSHHPPHGQQQLSISTSTPSSMLPSAPYNPQSVQTPTSSTSQPTSFFPHSSYHTPHYATPAHLQPRTTPSTESSATLPANSSTFTPSTPVSQQSHQLQTPAYPFTPESSESSRGHPYYTPYQIGASQPPGAPGLQDPSFTPYSDPSYTPTPAGPGVLVRRPSYPPPYFSRWYNHSGSTTPTGPHPYHCHAMVQRPAEPILAPGEDVAQRPPACYAALIAEALLLSDPPHQLLVSEISESIKSRYVYYRQFPSKIYNGVRHQTSMCKAFVKLNRPWGDQSGGARKWAIRDGCQNSFQMGSPTWTPPARFSQAAPQHTHKLKAKSRAVGKSKQLALGRGEDSPDREPSPFDDANGPSTGSAWDPERDPHPWHNEPQYQVHLAKRKAELAAAPHPQPEEQHAPHTPPAPQYYPGPSGSSGSSYSLSPVSPYSYSHQQYMSSGGWHPAYSPEPYHAPYHEPAPGTADPSRIGGNGGAGPSARSYESQSEYDVAPATPTHPTHYPYTAYPYATYTQPGGSMPQLYPTGYVPVSPPAAPDTGTAAPGTGGYTYWNGQMPHARPNGPNGGPNGGVSGGGPGGPSGAAVGLPSGFSGNPGSSFGSSNGGGPGNGFGGFSGGPSAAQNTYGGVNENDEDSPLTEIPTPEFKTEP